MCRRPQSSSEPLWRRPVLFKSDDLGRFSWRHLASFHNTSLVFDGIVSKHRIQRRHFSDAKKQAEQIRFCLIQAQEYMDASSHVSLATKPLLMYYCAMSMALAEALWKQDGNSSLDKIRGKHSHHGLEFRLSSRNGAALESAAGAMQAKPLQKKEERSGTFELWHRTARHAPLYGTYTTHFEGGNTTQCRPILLNHNVRMPHFPLEGLSLMTCIKLLPSLWSLLPHLGVRSELVRSRLSANEHVKRSYVENQLIVHPTPPERVRGVVDRIFFDPNAIGLIETTTIQDSSLILRWRQTELHDRYYADFPNGFNVDANEVFLCPYELSLNEFGLFYVSLFMSGMYSRYYPDNWHRDIEGRSPISIAIGYLLDTAADRLPVLLLSELTDSQFLLAA